MTDEELIDLFLERSDRAPETLQKKYRAYCTAILWQYLTDSRDVEECLNDVWLAVLEQLEQEAYIEYPESGRLHEYTDDSLVPVESEKNYGAVLHR